MLVACVCLACDANLAGPSLPGLESSQVTCAWDASDATELLEPGTLDPNLNILCRDVIDQKREMDWHEAVGQRCLLRSFLGSWWWLPVSGQLSWSSCSQPAGLHSAWTEQCYATPGASRHCCPTDK